MAMIIILIIYNYYHIIITTIIIVIVIVIIVVMCNTIVLWKCQVNMMTVHVQSSLLEKFLKW